MTTKRKTVGYPVKASTIFLPLSNENGKGEEKELNLNGKKQSGEEKEDFDVLDWKIIKYDAICDNDCFGEEEGDEGREREREREREEKSCLDSLYQSFPHLKVLTQQTSLDLKGIVLDDSVLVSLFHKPLNLQTLAIEGNFTEKGFGILLNNLKKCPKLRSFSLSFFMEKQTFFSPLTSRLLPELISALSHLEELSLIEKDKNISIETREKMLLSLSRKFKKLRILTLQGGFEFNPQNLEKIGKLRSLSQVSLSGFFSEDPLSSFLLSLGAKSTSSSLKDISLFNYGGKFKKEDEKEEEKEEGEKGEKERGKYPQVEKLYVSFEGAKKGETLPPLFLPDAFFPKLKSFRIDGVCDENDLFRFLSQNTTLEELHISSTAFLTIVPPNLRKLTIDALIPSPSSSHHTHNKYHHSPSPSPSPTSSPTFSPSSSLSPSPTNSTSPSFTTSPSHVITCPSPSSTISNTLFSSTSSHHASPSLSRIMSPQVSHLNRRSSHRNSPSLNFRSALPSFKRTNQLVEFISTKVPDTLTHLSLNGYGLDLNRISKVILNSPKVTNIQTSLIFDNVENLSVVSSYEYNLWKEGDWPLQTVVRIFLKNIITFLLPGEKTSFYRICFSNVPARELRLLSDQLAKIPFTMDYTFDNERFSSLIFTRSSSPLCQSDELEQKFRLPALIDPSFSSTLPSTLSLHPSSSSSSSSSLPQTSPHQNLLFNSSFSLSSPLSLLSTPDADGYPTNLSHSRESLSPLPFLSSSPLNSSRELGDEEMMEGYSYNDYDIPVPLSQRSLGSCFGKASYVWNSHHHIYTYQKNIGSPSFRGIAFEVSNENGKIFALKNTKVLPLDAGFNEKLNEMLCEVGAFGKIPRSPFLLPLEDVFIHVPQSNHPGIHFTGFPSGLSVSLCLVTPLINSGTLLAYIQRKEVLERNEIELFFKQLCKAVSLLHECNLVHNDIKLDNLFLEKEQGTNQLRLVLADYGELSENGGAARGNCFWWPPERDQESSASKAADVYSCGLCLAAMMTGLIKYHEISEFQNETTSQRLKRFKRAHARKIELIRKKMGEREDPSSSLDGGQTSSFTPRQNGTTKEKKEEEEDPPVEKREVVEEKEDKKKTTRSRKEKFPFTLTKLMWSCLNRNPTKRPEISRLCEVNFSENWSSLHNVLSRGNKTLLCGAKKVSRKAGEKVWNEIMMCEKAEAPLIEVMKMIQFDCKKYDQPLFSTGFFLLSVFLVKLGCTTSGRLRANTDDSEEKDAYLKIFGGSPATASSKAQRESTNRKTSMKKSNSELFYKNKDACVENMFSESEGQKTRFLLAQYFAVVGEDPLSCCLLSLLPELLSSSSSSSSSSSLTPRSSAFTTIQSHLSSDPPIEVNDLDRLLVSKSSFISLWTWLSPEKGVLLWMEYLFDFLLIHSPLPCVKGWKLRRDFEYHPLPYWVFPAETQTHCLFLSRRRPTTLKLVRIPFSDSQVHVLFSILDLLPCVYFEIGPGGQVVRCPGGFEALIRQLDASKDPEGAPALSLTRRSDRQELLPSPNLVDEMAHLNCWSSNLNSNLSNWGTNFQQVRENVSLVHRNKK